MCIVEPFFRSTDRRDKICLQIVRSVVHVWLHDMPMRGVRLFLCEQIYCPGYLCFLKPAVSFFTNSLVPGNTVGMDKKEGWVQSALESVSRCQHHGIEVVWPHSTCTCCCYVGNWRHELFLDGIFVIS